MAGLFDAFGVSAADVSENPFGISKPNRYECVLTDSDVKEFGDEGKQIPYWVNVYTIKGGPEDGKSANSMHRLIPWTQEERAMQGDVEAMNARLLSGYKKELMDLGIPEEAMNAFDPRNPAHRNKVVGMKGSAWFGPQKGKPGYNAVSEFKRTPKNEEAPAPSASSPSATTAPAGDVDLSALEGWD